MEAVDKWCTEVESIPEPSFAPPVSFSSESVDGSNHILSPLQSGYTCSEAPLTPESQPALTDSEELYPVRYHICALDIYLNPCLILKDNASVSSDGIRSEAQDAINHAIETLAVLQRQMDLAENAYEQMMLAAHGFRDFAEITRHELQQTSQKLCQYRSVAGERNASGLHYSPFVFQPYHDTGEFLLRGWEYADLIILTRVPTRQFWNGWGVACRGLRVVYNVGNPS